MQVPAMLQTATRQYVRKNRKRRSDVQKIRHKTVIILCFSIVW